MGIILKAENLSKWYGNILGISEISSEISQGVQGILGPNGAGKSTFLKIISGQLIPNLGTIRVFGQRVHNNHKLFNRVGFCPEYDCYYKDVKGLEFLIFKAKIHGFTGPQAEKKAAEAIDKVGLSDSSQKLVSSYSMGMRQRLKLASSIIHDPDLLVLDEPLRGVDPLWRVKIIKIIGEFEKQGKTVIVSSHILPEIEAMTNNVILIHQGKIFAHGDIQEIRNLIDAHPHMVAITSDKSRLLAEKMVNSPEVLNIQFYNDENKTVFNTSNRDTFFSELMKVIVDNNIKIDEITSPDDNLQAVFDYLIGR